MAQAKTVTERELKWALLILREPRLSDLSTPEQIYINLPER
jgi:hypothetical protein